MDFQGTASIMLRLALFLSMTNKKEKVDWHRQRLQNHLGRRGVRNRWN